MDGPSGEDANRDRLTADVAAAARRLSTATDVAVLGHVNPDADALGSALALAMGLRRRGCSARVSFGEPAELPRSLRGFDPEGLVVRPEDVPRVPEALVVCDCDCPERLGKLADRVSATAEAGGDVIVLDHHASNTSFGTLNVVDRGAEATVRLVLDLLDELGVEVDLPIARCLYAGLVTDTRSFRHASAQTHRVAARLLEAGVDPAGTARQLMDAHPFRWLRMLSAVLAEAQLEPAAARGLGLVHATVRLADSAGLSSEDLDGVIDLVRTAAEAEVAAVLKETAPRTWAVSLRANSRLDVGRAAVACGGGGHRLASGFSATGSAEEVLQRLRAALETAPLLS